MSSSLSVGCDTKLQISRNENNEVANYGLPWENREHFLQHGLSREACIELPEMRK